MDSSEASERSWEWGPACSCPMGFFLNWPSQLRAAFTVSSLPLWPSVSRFSPSGLESAECRAQCSVPGTKAKACPEPRHTWEPLAAFGLPQNFYSRPAQEIQTQGSKNFPIPKPNKSWISPLRGRISLLECSLWKREHVPSQSAFLLLPFLGQQIRHSSPSTPLPSFRAASVAHVWLRASSKGPLSDSAGFLSL